MAKEYSFVCRTCGKREDHPKPYPYPCPCGSILRRDYSSVGYTKSFVPHYNHSVGKYVRNESHFREELSKAEDAHSARTGLDCSFKQIEIGESPGVTREGLDETDKRNRDLGKSEPTKKIFT